MFLHKQEKREESKHARISKESLRCRCCLGFCVLMTSFLFFDGPRSVSEIDFVPQTKRRPDSRPTKHQKKERMRRGGVDTQKRAPGEKLELCSARSGVGGGQRDAPSHTLTADTFSVFHFFCVLLSLLCRVRGVWCRLFLFFWSCFFCFGATKKGPPVLHDANGSSVRCWRVFSLLAKGARQRGEKR